MQSKIGLFELFHHNPVIEQPQPLNERTFGMQRLDLNFHNDELITNFDSQSAGGESSSDFRIIKCPLCHRNVNLNANHSSSQDAVSRL